MRRYGPFALWLLVAALIALLTAINPTHYVSTDSQYYLSMAGWLVGLNGAQYGHHTAGWITDFPVGYPLLIGVMARLTGLSLLMASKLVNSLAIGAFLWLWQRRVGAVSVLWMGSVFLLGGFLRIITYTWSECVFLVVVLEGFWSVRALIGAPTDPKPYAFARLGVIGLCLFTLRYAGSFFVVAYGLWVLTTYRRSNWPIIRHRSKAGLLVGLFVTAYIAGTFYLNRRLSNQPLGTERFYETGETSWGKAYRLLLAPANELLLLRDHVPDQPATLVWLGLLLQIGLLTWLWRIVRPRRETVLSPSIREKQLLSVWLWASATYLTGLFTMRWFSPFPGPDARLMAPVTLPLLMGTALWVSRWPNLTLRRQVARWWIIFLLASWLQLLPQADLVEKVGNFFK